MHAGDGASRGGGKRSEASTAMATSAVMRVGAAASPGANVRRARTTTRAGAATRRNLERRRTTRSARVDGAVGRSRANHVPGAISDSRTTRTSTPAKSAPSPSPEFGSGALVEVDRPRGNSTTAQAMANSVNILLGVGLLSVPYALQQGGWAGLGVLGVLGVTTNYTGKILIRCQRRGSLPALDPDVDPSGMALGREANDCGGAGAAARGMITDADADAMDSLSCDWDDPHEPTRRPLLSYEDVGEAAFGAPGRNFITWVLYTELIGTCALFFILEGDHLEILFDHAHTQEWFMCAAAAVMIPTLWLADLSSLAFIGGLGACASLSLVGVVLYELVAVGGFPTTLPPALSTTALVHLGTLPVSFGLLAFVFAGHAVFPAIYTSMRAPEEYEEMLDKTYAIVGATCLLIGGAGYALYGDGVADEVTLNLPAGLASTLALALVTVNPFSKFALTMDPVSRGLEKALGVDINGGGGGGEGDGVDGDWGAPLKARLMRTGLGAGALLTAAKVPFFAVFMSLIGSFLTLTVSVIFPSACYLRMFEDELTDNERVANWAIMLLGGFCVVAGSASAINAALDQF